MLVRITQDMQAVIAPLTFASPRRSVRRGGQTFLRCAGLLALAAQGSSSVTSGEHADCRRHGLPDS